MSQSLVSFRMDSDLKADMDRVCRELGMNMTTAFTIFARKVCREERIPFDVSLHPRPNAETLAAMRETEDILAGRVKAKCYDNAAEMIADILAEEEDDVEDRDHVALQA